MGTLTTNYSFNKPTVGGDVDSWGTDTNANWDSLDALLSGTGAISGAVLNGCTIGSGEVGDGSFNDLNAAGVVDFSGATSTTLGGFSGGVATLTSISLLGQTITVGTGSPESVVTAPVGSLYLRTDGGASTTLYVKESGVGNTGWVAK